MPHQHRSGTNHTGAFGTCGTYNDHDTDVASGTWGPEVHTYASPASVPPSICVNMYDVHDTIANKSDDYLVDKNNDNSIQTNDFDPSNGGSTCFSPGALHITPTVTTTPHIGSTPISGPVNLGQTVTDVALVQGVGTLQPTGDVAFTVCGPFTTATACTTGDSTAMALGDPNVPTSTTPDSATYTSNPFTPTVAGVYCFLGHYSGDTLYLAGSDSSTTT